jgi:hypothetical protein
MTDAPLNPLETAIRDGMAGRASAAELHTAVLQSTLYVPSVIEVPQGGEDYQPILLPNPGLEIGMIVVFTDPSRITADAKARAPYIFEVEGPRFILTLPSNLGLVLFAGPDAAAELSPAALLGMRRSMLG